MLNDKFSIATSTSSFRISKDDNGNVPFPGRIDDVRIYNRALSAAEIAYLCTGPWPSYGAQIFPIVTNDTAPFGDSVARAGTNYLVGIQGDITTSGVFVSPSGAVGTLFSIGQTISPNRNFASVLFNGTNYLVLWNFDSETNGAGNPVWNISGRFVTPSGTFPGNEFPIVTNGNPLYPSAAFDGANYLMSWNVNFPATNSNVQFQFLNGGGQPMGPPFAPFPAQGSEAPMLTLPIYDGTQFVAVTTLSADGGTPTNNAAIYGAFIPASTTPPQFGPGSSYGNRQFWLSLAGTPGINYAIQMATNLASPNWTALATNSPTNGPFTFTDTGATNCTRFYRAVKR